jgi:pilus assembly protein CpaC
MAPSFRRARGHSRSGATPRVLLAGLLLFALAATRAAAQPPVGPPVAVPPGDMNPPVGDMGPLGPTSREPPCDTPPIPVAPPRTAEAATIVESARCSDGIIEVILGQSRIVVVKVDLQTPRKSAHIDIGSPAIASVTLWPENPKDQAVIIPRRAIQILGKKVGVTDLVIQTPDDKIYRFEVRVVQDPALLRDQLQLINAQLHVYFPDASLKVSAVRDYFVVEGEARSAAQVARILETVRAAIGEQPSSEIASQGVGPSGPYAFASLVGGRSRVINLMRVVGSQQVLLKVRVAELDRTAMREIGADFLSFDKASPLAVGTNLGNSSMIASGGFNSVGNAAALTISATGANLPGTTTAFGIFNRGDFEVFISALRKNQLLKILAEPNLVAMNGQRANFLAGGSFFVPTAQTAIGGVAGGVTAQQQEFGVRLEFLAHILEDDVIRLTVDPEVSQPDFAVATTLVAGGSPVPGLNKRSAHTTVELHQGQTLAIAGLMAVTLDGTTTRVPGLGDLPILGPFFSNTTGSRTEKELVVLVTPYLVEPMNADQVPPTPGDEVKEPNDLEFYLLNRIEGRTGVDYRSTTHYDDATYFLRCLLRLHDDKVRGPKGYCE